MKRWALAGAGLAAAALVFWAVVATDSPNVGGVEPTGAAPAVAQSASGPTHRVAASARTIIELPHVPADGTRAIRLTRGMLEQARRDGRLDVQLPDGKRFPVVLESDRMSPGDQWTATGRVQTRLGPQAMVITSGPDAVFGVLPLPDGSMMQITTTRGRTEIAPAGDMHPAGANRRRTSQPDYVVPDLPRHAVAKATADTPLVAQAAKSTSPVEVVVLGLYTDDLVELRGSVAAAETEVTNLFAIANQAYLDSGTRVRLSVAQLRQVQVDPALDNHAALYAITDNTVPSIDLHQLRDELAADLIALLRPNLETHWSCGVAWLNGADGVPIGFYDHYGVSVSNVAPCGPLVLAHELGHNMGSTHDRITESRNGYLEFGAYPYSFGHVQDGPPAFATVMAYSQGQPWIGYFSNPGSTRCGDKCGVEGHTDNVRSLNNTVSAVAGFRSPPGTLSIVDTAIYEPEPGESRSVVFPVRLAGPAPAGGVHFDVKVSGGTARSGVDYLPLEQTAHSIAEGERAVNVSIEIIGDADEEPDETVVLQLTNIVGATVHQAEATATILNDDPRPVLSGRFRFHGAPIPDSAFPLVVSGVQGSFGPVEVEVSPPSFSYSVPVVRGASVDVEVHAPPPFAIMPFTVEEVRIPTVRDITLRKGMHVFGKVTWPKGQPAPDEPIELSVRASIDTRYQPLPSTSLQPPDFDYAYWVVPGSWLYMQAAPPDPYQPFFVTHSYLGSDLVQNIPLSHLPGLVLWGGGRTRVAPDVIGTMDFSVQLSAPAPAGGVRMRYRTVDGTARAGTHYTAIEGTIEIPEGEIASYTDTVEWFGSSITGDRYFDVVLTDIVGANPIVSRLRVILAEQDREMSDPLLPRRRR